MVLNNRNMEELVKKLIDIAEKEGLTAYEISKKSKISQPTVARLLKGGSEKTSEKILKKIKLYISRYENVSITGNYNQVGENTMKVSESKPPLAYYMIDDEVREIIEEKDKKIEKLTKELLDCKNKMIDLLTKK